MDIHQIFQIKLKKELSEELLNEYGNSYPKEKILQCIDEKVKNYKIKLDDTPTEKISDEDDIHRCCARTWNGHYGGRCTHKTNGSDYCKKHQNIIDEQDVLHFGRYDGPRPKINSKGNKIPWYNYDSLTMLTILIQYQSIQYLRLMK
tara:strand:- start:533 stop:973 length:441 start_codon:yes stop_codon:yes gene_type:complete